MRFLREEQEIPTSELEIGSKIELEHAPTLKKIKDYFDINKEFPTIEIVADWIRDDHLKEFNSYYNDKIGLPSMERNLKKEGN